MSRLLKISLLRLTMQSSDQKGISVDKKAEQFAASPTLVNRLDIPEINKQAYLNKRRELLNKKETTHIYDKRLRTYQNQDVGFLMSLKSKGIFNQQRTGKTPTTLVTMRELKEFNGLIVAPGATLFSWAVEYAKWNGGPVTVLSNRIKKARRLEIIKEFKGTIITTYMLTKNDLDAYINRSAETIVVDEAHRLRNYRGHRSNNSPTFTKAIITLSRLAKGRYALTGTPTPNKQHNIYGILAFLFPTLFKSYWSFIDYYFETKEVIINRDQDTIIEIMDFKSKEREQEMIELMETISIQRKRKDVMKWLKELIPTKITIPQSKKQLKLLDEMHNYYEIEGTDVIALNDLSRMMLERQLELDPRIVGINLEGEFTKWLKQYISDYPEKKIIIASMFTKYLKLLHEELKGTTLIVGGLSDKKKSDIETRFNKGEIPILLANIDVIKEGMKLYGADVIIMPDRSLTYTDNEQVGDRPLPITEAIQEKKDGQEIIILTSDSMIGKYIDQMLKLKKSRTDILNDYNAVCPPRLRHTTRK